MNEDAKINATKLSFQVVETVYDLNDPGVTEIANTTDIPRSTVFDHLQTLEQLGFLINRDGTYRTSTRFLALGNRARNDMKIYSKSNPRLEELSQDVQEFVGLEIMENGLSVLLSVIEGQKASRMGVGNVYAGLRTRLHTTATGKAILSQLPDTRVREIIDRYPLNASTENTITNEEILFENLAEIRDQGYALDLEERFSGMQGIGAPIVSTDEGIIGAIFVYGPRNRLSDDRLETEIADKVLETANEIQVGLDLS